MVAALVLGIVGLTACGGDDDVVNAPCPKPEGILVPAHATVAIGGTATVALPSDISLQGRRMQWVITPSGIAMSDGISTSRSATVTGTTSGWAAVKATDLNSASNCRDVWNGDITVQ
jgi:hypothetical protein